MKIIKYTHGCLRIEADGRVLVIDPGEWSEPEALIGADAVIVTHEHSDHVDPARLAGTGIPVFAPEGAEIPDLDLVRVRPGQAFEAAGFAIRTVGARHAFIYDGQPDCPNLGYVVDDRLYHPGDALAIPDGPIETLCVPAAGSWLKLAEAIEFVKAVKPQRTFPIHEAALSERGTRSLNAWHGEVTGHGYRWLDPGESL
jgi:L-ascorbate metabolism protein UlaG (beta-lactamase superfamily)